MGLYRATLNMAGLKAGKTGPFDDNDINVRRMVASHFLVPVDAVAQAAQEEPLTFTELPVKSKQDQIKAALDAARASAPAEEPSTVSTTAPIPSAAPSVISESSNPVAAATRPTRGRPPKNRTT